jgi:lipopolysaccharide export system permease protein
MRALDRYLLREFAQSVSASLVVLGMVSMSALVGVVLDRIARGKVPATLMLSQLGLQLLSYLPLILPLALMLGLLLSLGRLYRDSEMPVLAAVGVAPDACSGPWRCCWCRCCWWSGRARSGSGRGASACPTR